MSRPPTDDGPDPLALAAWVEGRLDQHERQGIEALLAQRPELLDAVLAGIAAVDRPELPGRDVLKAARATVTAHCSRASGRPSRHLVGTAVAAGLILMVATGGGFDLGRDIALWQSGQETAVAEQILGSLLASSHDVLLPGQP